MDFRIPGGDKSTSVPDLKWMIEDIESKKFSEDKLIAIKSHLGELQALANQPTAKVLLSKIPVAREQYAKLQQSFMTLQMLYSKIDDGRTLLAREEQTLKDTIANAKKLAEQLTKTGVHG